MQDKNVLLFGDSGGIGSALRSELIKRGYEITAFNRSRDNFDVTSEESVARAADSIGSKRFKLVINAIGSLAIEGYQPEKTLRSIQAEGMAKQFAVNAIGTALLLKYFGGFLLTSEQAVFASLSARVGSIGDNRRGGWISYRAAKAAHNQIVRTAAIEIARSNPKAIVIALHPGTVATSLTAEYLARHPSVAPQIAAAMLVDVVTGLGPEQNGTFIDQHGIEVLW